MIRYVHIGDQINDGWDEFAFYDTVSDRFVTVGDEQTFKSRKDLREALAVNAEEPGVRELGARLLALLPDDKNKRERLMSPEDRQRDERNVVRSGRAEEHPLESVHTCMVTDARDWSARSSDAWLYGILVGWGAALPEVAARHGWDEATVVRLLRLRERLARGCECKPMSEQADASDRRWRRYWDEVPTGEGYVELLRDGALLVQGSDERGQYVDVLMPEDDERGTYAYVTAVGDGHVETDDPQGDPEALEVSYDLETLCWRPLP